MKRNIIPIWMWITHLTLNICRRAIVRKRNGDDHQQLEPMGNEEGHLRKSFLWSR